MSNSIPLMRSVFKRQTEFHIEKVITGNNAIYLSSFAELTFGDEKFYNKIAYHIDFVEEEDQLKTSYMDFHVDTLGLVQFLGIASLPENKKQLISN